MPLILFLAAPTVALIFSLSEYLGWLDHLLGRKKALEGFDRLRFVYGFPKNLILAEEDQEIFDALIKRIAKNSRHAAELKLRFAQGETPSVITIFGKPQPIDGLPTDWEQTERFFFPSEQPILVIFNWYKTQLDVLSKHQSGTAYNVGTLADLREWLATEKEQRKFWVGTFIVSCVSIGSILLRFKLQT